jgi:hypothetical protein
LFAINIINYIDRAAISYSIPKIVQEFDDDGRFRHRAIAPSSRSTGISAMGQTARKAACEASSRKSTMIGSKGMRLRPIDQPIDLTAADVTGDGKADVVGFGYGGVHASQSEFISI